MLKTGKLSSKYVLMTVIDDDVLPIAKRGGRQIQKSDVTSQASDWLL